MEPTYSNGREFAGTLTQRPGSVAVVPEDPGWNLPNAKHTGKGGSIMASLIRRRDTDHLNPERILSRFFSEPLLGGFDLPALAEEGTLPVDVSEDEESVMVRASLPGFRKEDVNIEVHDGMLSINAHQEHESEEKNERFYRRERSSGSVSRRVALPSAVQEDQAEAELKDGVLMVQIPKSQEASPRRIQIK
jgi:HSP20 family protein